jgi:hypothetical protein
VTTATRYDSDRRAWLLSGAIAGLALVPYVAIALPFETGLRCQAAVTLAILALVGGTAWRGAVAAVRALPRAVRWGLLLYGGAAAWGTAVGLVSGNPLRYVVSQALSMALLPAGALAFSAHSRFRGRELGRGLAIAAVTALAIHALALAVPWVGSVLEPSELRFTLRYATGFSGRDVLAALVALAFALAAGSRLGAAGGVAALILVAGSMSRGAWAATVAGLLIVGVLLAGHATRRAPVVTAVVGVVLAAAIALVAWGGGGAPLRRFDFEDPAAGAAWTRSSAARSGSGAAEVVLSAPQPAHALTPPVPVASPALAIDCWVQGELGKQASLWVRAKDADGRTIRMLGTRMRGVSGWVPMQWVVLLPLHTTTVQVGLWGRDGRWLVDDLAIETLSGSLAAAARALRDRLTSVGWAATDPAADATVSYRLGELGAIMGRWRDGGLGRVAIGYGLGARFTFLNAGWSAAGQRTLEPEASYIHDFFVFLAFKLGLAGIAALGGLLLVAVWTAASAWAGRGRPAESWVLASGAAVWAAYLLWGVSSPEVIDFRVAPLLGALVAACVGCSRPAADRASDA